MRQRGRAAARTTAWLVALACHGAVHGACCGADAVVQAPAARADGPPDAAAAAVAAAPAAPAARARGSLPPIPSGTFRLAGVQFQGATAFDGDVLFSLVADFLRKPVGLSELEVMAERVTQHYRSNGYFLAQAIVPQQQVRDGVVEISVLEGRLGKVRLAVATDAPISAARVQAILARLPVGAPVHAQTYERTMLMLSDLPGIRVRSGLEAGVETGTTDLVVEVTGTRRWAAAVDADNYGSRVTGRTRIGVTGRWASPFSIGDNLDGRLMTSSGGGLTFGRVAYEAPVGAAGARVGGGFSRVSYSLGGDLEVLDAKGTADVVDLSASLPLIRSRARNLLARTAIEHKSLTDEIRAVGLRTEKTVNDASFALLWDGRDSVFGGGWGGASLTLWLGHLSIDDAQQSALDGGPTGRHTAGSYAKFALQASRLQRITERNNLYVAVAGQLASRNLDASEKFALGGPKAVRAYPGAEVLVDDGMLVTAEWRYSPLDELAVSLFYDAARGRVNHDPFDNEPDNVRTLRGPGVGLNWSRPGNFAANASLAWRDTAPAISDGQDRNPRLYLQLQKSF